MSVRSTEVDNARIFSANQILLPDISYKAFSYPGDEEALGALKKVPGAPALLTYLQENFTEQLVFVENNEQMIRAGRASYASLHRLVERCADILSCPLPDLYIKNDPVMNAYTAGHRRTCIVLHSSVIESMTADELSFVVGHEIGHIKCGHGLYRQLGSLLLQYWDAVSSLIPVPGLGLLRIPLLLAYWEWYRRAEFTCDRAGLLCVQDPQPALTGLAKLAGKVSGFEDELNVETAIAQGHAHGEVNKLVMVVSILNNATNTHPFVPARLKQAKEYAAGADYVRTLRGEYERDPLGLHEGGMRIKCVCGAKVNKKLNFCPQCGRPVEEQPAELAVSGACNNCGRPLAPGTRFCPNCGAQSGATPPPPPALPPSGAIDKMKAAAGFLKRS